MLNSPQHIGISTTLPFTDKILLCRLIIWLTSLKSFNLQFCRPLFNFFFIILPLNSKIIFFISMHK